MTDEDYMRKAIAKAKEGIAQGQSPFGACIVKDNEVVALVHNQVWKSGDITAHAEVTAIREACRRLKAIDLSGAVIYSTCEPCPMCFSACHWARLSKIFFGSRIEDAKGLGFSELTISNETMKKWGESPIEIEGDLLRKESLKLFESWSRTRGNGSY
ncbi:MAG: nucleoside deaminase [bacterium]